VAQRRPEPKYWSHTVEVGQSEEFGFNGDNFRIRHLSGKNVQISQLNNFSNECNDSLLECWRYLEY
jgi:hypothetical protein